MEELSKNQIRLKKKANRPTGFVFVKNIILWSFILMVLFIISEIIYDFIEKSGGFDNSYRRSNYGNNLINNLLSKNPFTEARKVFMWIILVGIPSLVGLVLISNLMNNNKN